MKKVIFALVLLIITGYGYEQYQENTVPEIPAISSIEDNAVTKPVLLPVENNESIKPVSNSHYNCDGRMYCAEMTSCAEATFFINNCPDSKGMDRNKNGVPCEEKWCH